MRNIGVLLRASCLMLASVVAFLPTISTAQTVDSAYENAQRVKALLLLEPEIRSLPDVEVRCQLRFNILEFIYSKEVRSEYGNAEAIMITFFDEMAANEKQLGNRHLFWRNKTAILLRKHDPETAKKIEAKYVPEVDTFGDEFESLRPNSNLAEVVERTIETLNKRQDLGSILNIYEGVRRFSPESGSRILDAALKVSEEQPIPKDAATLDRMVDQVLNPPAPTVSEEHLIKYYRILVAASRIELAKPTPDGSYVATMWPLRRALPKIKVVDQGLYSEAQSIVLKYRKSLPKGQLAREEADDRIEAADNKPERAIAEAESATSPEVKDYLWGRASQIAGIQKNYKQAVDLLMKAGPTVGVADQPAARDLRLSTLAYRAQNSGEYESARYAIGFIKDDTSRARSLLEYSFDFGRMNQIDRPKAVELAFEAIGQLERAGPTPDSICTVGNIRHIVLPVTVGDLTARTVRLVNMVSPGELSVKGSTDQKELVMRPLTRMIPCVSHLFRPILNLPPSDLDLVNQIKVKEWRLAARIEVEKARRFPLAQ